MEKLVLGGLALSQGVNKQFSELDLCKTSSCSIEKLEQLIATNTLKKFFYVDNNIIQCKNCKEILDKIYVVCPICDAKLSASRYKFGMKYRECGLFLQEKVEGNFIFKDWKKIGSHLTKNKLKISIKVICQKLTPQLCYEMLGIAKISEKCNELILFTPMEIMDSEVNTIEGINVRNLTDIFSEKTMSLLVSLMDNLANLSRELSIDEIDLNEIKAKKNYIYTRILDLAKQENNKNSSGTGYSFENAAITLLYSPLFPARQIHGKNIDDGIMLYEGIKEGESPVLVPISVKSSKYQPFRITQEVQDQLRKYIKAMKELNILRVIKVHSYIIIVGSISADDKNNNQAVDALESEFSIKLVVMPVDVLIRIHKQATEKTIHYFGMQKQILYFLKSKRYLTTSDVDTLFFELDKAQKQSLGTWAIDQIKNNVKSKNARAFPK